MQRRLLFIRLRKHVPIARLAKTCDKLINEPCDFESLPYETVEKPTQAHGTLLC